MKVLVLVEVIYDAREPIAGLPNLPPKEVVVKRFGLTGDHTVSLEALCQKEGQKVLDAAPGASPCYNPRIVVTGFQIDGVPAEPKHLLVVGLKTPQKA